MMNSHNFSISSNLTQMVNFPTWISDCDCHSPAFLDLFSSCNTSIGYTMAFTSLVNYDHVVLLVSINFLTNSKQVTLFHCIAYDYSLAVWDSLWDHLRGVPWEDIFKLRVSAAASEFCVWFQVRVDVYIPYRMYQVKCHSCP